MNLARNAWRHLKASKGKLISAPVISAPEWGKEFEIMCDDSDYAMGVVLGQRRDKVFRAIYYKSKTFNEAQENYSKTEKEMLVVVFSCEKFKPYILCDALKPGGPLTNLQPAENLWMG